MVIGDASTLTPEAAEELEEAFRRVGAPKRQRLTVEEKHHAAIAILELMTRRGLTRVQQRQVLGRAKVILDLAE